MLSVNEFSFFIGFALKALSNKVPFILFEILAVAYIKSPSAENVIARAFEGAEERMVILAAMLGGLSPFCSCEVIPFIATLLAVGIQLSAVMAFWLKSSLMDPANFNNKRYAGLALCAGKDFRRPVTRKAESRRIL